MILGSIVVDLVISRNEEVIKEMAAETVIGMIDSKMNSINDYLKKIDLSSVQ